MWTDFISLDLVFELTLFLLVVVVLVQLYLTYGRAYIAGQIQTINAKWRRLENSNDIMHQAGITAQQQLIAEQELTRTIGQKLTVWHNACQALRRRSRTDQEKLATQLIARKEHQKKELHDIKLSALVVPRALEQAMATLEPLHNSKRGRDLLADLINSLTPPAHK